MKLSKDQFRTVIGSRTPDKNMKRFAFFFSMMIVMTLTGCDNSDLDVTYNTKEDSEELIIPHTVLSMDSYSPDDFCDRVHSNKFMQNQLGDNEIANKIYSGAIKTLVELRKPQMDKTFAKQSANNSGWQVQTCTCQRKTHHPVWTHHLPQCQGWQWTQGEIAVTLCALLP